MLKYNFDSRLQDDFTISRNVCEYLAITILVLEYISRL